MAKSFILLFFTVTCFAAPVKNFILLIPDGMSMGGVTLARWYSGKPLAMDAIVSGLVRTYNADAPIADSAPAATAFATGYKSHTGFIGILPEKNNMPGLPALSADDMKRPVATVLEAAKRKGKSTGIISTSQVQHATPAAFTAHIDDRDRYDDIAEQQVNLGIDVVLGAGSKYLDAGKRKDKKDIIGAIKKRGYTYASTKQELSSAKGRLWGMFAADAMSYDMDRDAAKEPSLAEMTIKAMEILSKNTNGFFLMVEGSKIDWASHANDPIGVISDILAFDAAVREALRFAAADASTAVLFVPDHGNGGITIGDRALSKGYDTAPLAAFLDPLKRAKRTAEGVEKMLTPDRANLAQLIRAEFGITDLSAEEMTEAEKAPKGKLNYALGPAISRRAHIGWTTHGHTGEDVIFGLSVPAGAERIGGVVENTDIARFIERTLALDLKRTTEDLFVPVTTLFPGASFSEDTNARTLTITHAGKAVTITENALYGGKADALGGIALRIGTRWYAPRSLAR